MQAGTARENTRWRIRAGISIRYRSTRSIVILPDYMDWDFLSWLDVHRSRCFWRRDRRSRFIRRGMFDYSFSRVFFLAFSDLSSSFNFLCFLKYAIIINAPWINHAIASHIIEFV